jgi:hypothetical protein
VVVLPHPEGPSRLKNSPVHLEVDVVDGDDLAEGLDDLDQADIDSRHG